MPKREDIPYVNVMIQARVMKDSAGILPLDIVGSALDNAGVPHNIEVLDDYVCNVCGVSVDPDHKHWTLCCDNVFHDECVAKHEQNDH